MGRFRAGQPGLRARSPSASSSGAAWSPRASSSSRPARRAFDDLVEGGSARPNRWSSCPPHSASGPAPWAPLAARRARRRGSVSVIRTGVVLPDFRETPGRCPRGGDEAFAAGVDGVFCYDHIWPMGQPDRPALAPFPVLAALAADVPAPATARRRPVFRDAGGPGRAGAQRGAAGAVQGAGQPGARPHHRRPGYRGPAERGREPGLRHPLPPGGRTPGGHGRPGPGAAGPGLHRSGWPAARRPGPPKRWPPAAALNVWDADPALVAARAHGPDAVEVTWAGPAALPTKSSTAPWRRWHRPVRPGPSSGGRSISSRWRPRPGRRRVSAKVLAAGRRERAGHGGGDGRGGG